MKGRAFNDKHSTLERAKVSACQKDKNVSGPDQTLELQTMSRKGGMFWCQSRSKLGQLAEERIGGEGIWAQMLVSPPSEEFPQLIPTAAGLLPGTRATGMPGEGADVVGQIPEQRSLSRKALGQAKTVPKRYSTCVGSMSWGLK